MGYQKVSLDGDKVTLEKGATLDLGATGKGIGCDVVSDFLKTAERCSRNDPEPWRQQCYGLR